MSLSDVAMKPVGTQVRDPGDGRWYSPDRDIAYLGPELIRRAFELGDVDTLRQDPNYAQLLAGVSVAGEEELKANVEAAAKALATGVNVCWRGSPVGPDDAFGEFASVPGPAGQIFLLRLGELLLGAIFTALQDVTPVDSSPPHARSLQSLVESAAAISDRLAATDR